MKRVALIAYGCALLAGCTDGSTSELTEGNGPKGVISLGEEQGVDAPDIIVEPVALEWEGIGNDAAVETTILSLKVTSQSESELQVGIGIECSGLLGKQAVLPIGSIILMGGDEETLNIPVADLPIRNAVGASQLSAVAIVRETSASLAVPPEIVGSSNLYYRFDTAYQNATFFSKKVLETAYGGCLAGVCTGNNDPEQVLGMVADGAGGFSVVKLSDQTTTETVGDKIIARPTGMSIGEGDQPDNLGE